MVTKPPTALGHPPEQSVERRGGYVPEPGSVFRTQLAGGRTDGFGQSGRCFSGRRRERNPESGTGLVVEERYQPGHRCGLTGPRATRQDRDAGKYGYGCGQGLVISLITDQSRKQAMQCGGEPILVNLGGRCREPSLQLPPDELFLLPVALEIQQAVSET